MVSSQSSSDDEWPIAAAMINFPSVNRQGVTTQDQTAEEWSATLRQVARAGFRLVDPTDSWLRVADLEPGRRDEFRSVAADAGLELAAISTARRSVIDVEHGEENLAYSHRVIDTAAELGLADVSFGLFQSLTPAQQRALWFWTAPGYTDPDSTDAWELAVRRYQELADHAARVGVELSLEMYEDTYLGTADSSVRLLNDIDRDNVWLNPDIGNLQRLHRPVEHWQQMIEKTVPFARYWHVKNYVRTEDASTGSVHTAPAPMELGVINYRWAVEFALESGFVGTFLCEHYGGDGLTVSGRNRAYLLDLLDGRTPVSPAGVPADRRDRQVVLHR